MKDEELQFDRTCHALYSKPCKKRIKAKIAPHSPAAIKTSILLHELDQLQSDIKMPDLENLSPEEIHGVTLARQALDDYIAARKKAISESLQAPPMT